MLHCRRLQLASQFALEISPLLALKKSIQAATLGDPHGKELRGAFKREALQPRVSEKSGLTSSNCKADESAHTERTRPLPSQAST